MSDELNQRKKAANGLRFTLGLTKAIIREEKEIEMLNKIYCGDNLEFMHSLPDECIDLIYIDPPLFSTRNDKVVLGDEVLSFEAKWDDFQHYLTWMSERFKEMDRILKTTGSIFVHHDDENYELGFIIDKIFSKYNCLNYIKWHYGKPVMIDSKIKTSETIRYYTKSQEPTFNHLYENKTSPLYEKLKHLVDNNISPKLIDRFLKAQKLRLGRDLEKDDIIYDLGDFISNYWKLPSIKKTRKKI